MSKNKKPAEFKINTISEIQEPAATAEVPEVKDPAATAEVPELTSISDYEIDFPEFGNMTEVAIKEWLSNNPGVPADKSISGFPARIWQLSRKFGLSVEGMAKLAEKNKL